MKENLHSRIQVLYASLEFCKGHFYSNRNGSPSWHLMTERMKFLIKANAEESKRLAFFGSEIAENLDQPKKIAQVLDGEWMLILSKVLHTVVSPENKRERLNCAISTPTEFPFLLTVIQAVAYGAPASLWDPVAEKYSNCTVGMVESMDPDDSDGLDWQERIMAKHEAIANSSWYRPQLVMLVSSLWPKTMRHAYYGSTLEHIINPEG